MKETKNENLRRIRDLHSYFKDKSKASIRTFTKDNERFEKYMKDFKIYYASNKENVDSDFKAAFNLVYGDNYLNDYETVFNEQKINDEAFKLFIEVHVYYSLYVMLLVEEEKVIDIEKLLFKDEPNGTSWYRGQTNSAWNMNPSFFRNAKENKVIKWLDILKEYKDRPSNKSLYTKLSEVGITNNYRITSFIQHSIGYSPLIDFTKSAPVALSFALSNYSSMFDFYNNDAALYEMNINTSNILTDEKEIDEVLNNLKVFVFKEPIYIYQLLISDVWEDFLNENTISKIHLIDAPTNDRMIFQKGTFILFDHVIIIGGRIYFKYDKKQFSSPIIRKYIINRKQKEDLYQRLMDRYSRYHKRYIYDPYLYLSEPDGK